MKKLIIPFLSGILLLSAACSSWNFEGEEQPPFSTDSRALFFAEPKAVPADFEKIGTFTYNSPAGMRSNEIRRYIRKRAMKCGANGILILEMNQIAAGEARLDQLQNHTAPGWNTNDNTNTAYTKTVDNIQYSSGSDPDKNIYRFEVKGELFRGPDVPTEKP